MNRLAHKTKNQALRRSRVRQQVSGSTERPRLSVKISVRHITAQLIDDTKHQTLVYVTTIGQKDTGKNLSDKATWAGSNLAKKATAKKIKGVVFDRGAKLYHGRIKALATAARENGLEF